MKIKISFFIIFYIIAMLIITGCGIQRISKKERPLFIIENTIHVYPIHIFSINRTESYDTVIAKKIVLFINQHQGLNAVFVNRNPDTSNEWFMNEAKMYKKSVTAFSEFIKTDLKNENCALLVEFLWAPRELDLHYALIDKKSDKGVLLGLINSHNPIHQKIKPQNNDEAFTLFCKVFDEEMISIK